MANIVAHQGMMDSCYTVYLHCNCADVEEQVSYQEQAQPYKSSTAAQKARQV